MLLIGHYVSYGQSPDTLSMKQTDTLIVKKDTLIADSLTLADDLKSKVKYTADDSIVYAIDGKKIFLYGHAEITYEDINLKADYVEINYETRTLTAHGVPDSSGKMAGLPVFKQGSEEFNSDNIRYNFDTKRGKISEITTKDGDKYIHGETVKKEPDNTTYIRNGYFTTCDLPHPHYFIFSKKIKIIPNNKVVTGPADLFIADVPTPLMIPFGFFPNHKGRTSGILFPSYGESNQLGFYLKNGGYYYGNSDKFDLALTGDIFSRGSWKGFLSSNYANRYHYNGNVSLSYSKTLIGDRELPDFSLEKDFFITWNHTQDPKARPNSNFSANVNAGTSTNFRNTLSTANNYLTNTFSSYIGYSKTWVGKPYSFTSSLRHSQNSITRDISISIPSASFSVGRFSPFQSKSQIGAAKWYEKIGVSYSATLLNTINTKDTLLFKKESLDRFQYGLQHSIPISTSFTVAKFFTVTPSFNYNERWYLKTYEKRYIPGNDSLVIDTISGFKAARDFGFSTSMSTRVFGLKQFRRGKIAAIRHVLTPSIGFSWRPDFSEDKWKAYKSTQVDSIGTIQRYSIYDGTIFGGPGSGKSSLLNFSLDNSLEMKIRQQTDTAVNIKKVKVLESLSLAGNYNFAADSLKLSIISVAARTIVFERLNLSLSSSFDPYVVNALEVRQNKTEWEANGKLARLRNVNFSADFSLTNSKKQYSSKKGVGNELDDINKNPEDYIDYSIPINLSLHYNYSFQNNVNIADQTTQVFGFSGDVKVTDNWKVNFASGYDFNQKDISYTSLGIFRDLHCWEMRLNWVPFGFAANYFFQINVKSSILQDLKLTKNPDRFDRR